MKLKLLSAILGATIGAGALAAPIALPSGPLYFQFTNVERSDLALNADGTPRNNLDHCPNCSNTPEGNWGVAQVSVMRAGVTNPNGATAGQVGNDINSKGTPPFFTDQVAPAGAQITAMFHGSTFTSIVKNGTSYSLQSSGGYIDLYWDDPSLSNTIVNISTLAPTGRTSDAGFTGVTDGVLLARLAFASGVNASNANIDIQGAFDRAISGDAGFAESYANVADFNGDGVIDSNDGLWAGQLNTDWFGTVFGTRDIRFSNRIQNNTAWDATWTNEVFGQTSNDPGRAMVPEPASLALVSLGLLGLGAARRRRNV